MNPRANEAKQIMEVDDTKLAMKQLSRGNYLIQIDDLMWAEIDDSLWVRNWGDESERTAYPNSQAG